MKKHKDRRAVVVGGAGYIGSHLALEAKEHYQEVLVIDVRDPDTSIPGVVSIKADIRDQKELERIFPEGSDVFHLAALPRVQYSIEHPVETHDVNVNGTLALLLAAKSARVRRVIYSSSSSAYGDQKTFPLKEEFSTRPGSPYGLQKLIGEEYTRLFAEIYGLPTVSLRYFNVYGGRMNADDPYSLVMGIFIKAKREGKPLPITGDGTQSRDFTHIRDVVRANLLAAESERVGKGEAMNIGSGNPTTILRLAQLFGGEVVHIPPRIEPHRTHADWSRAKALIGWEPSVSIEEGVQEILKSL